MRRRRLFYTGIGLLAMVALLLLCFSRYQARVGPVYTVAQVTHGIQKDPGRWFGHTVSVRGLATDDVPGLAFHLMDVRSPDLWVVEYGQEDGTRAIFRGLPFLRLLVPPLQHVTLGVAADYWIQIIDAPTDCSLSRCAVFKLADAVPAPSRGTQGDFSPAGPLNHSQ